MKYDIAFSIPYYTESNSTFPIPVNGNYNYWGPLIKYFLPKSDTIEIHCWNEEVDVIKEIIKINFNNYEMAIEKNITVFRIKKCFVISDYLLNKYITNGEFKWFTVNLDKGEKSVFHSGHWATEFFVPNATDNVFEVIKRVTPNETSIHQ
ncbi:MAG: hypothetical protein K0S34_1656 [Bacillales bacterium]|jgi:hypothetical protein|nr:hypothetical protein [Bacillales bacterium]